MPGWARLPAESEAVKVFIGGSRKISRLGAEIRQRIDRMVEKHLPIVVGDANGADKAVQRYLHERGHNLVEVFSAEAEPRNNIGGWPVRVIRASHRTKDFDFYAAKDKAMASEASVALMIWDGESRGTLLNILRLVEQRKPAVVWVSPKGSFVDVRTAATFEILLADLDRRSRQRFEEQAASEGLAAVPPLLRA